MQPWRSGLRHTAADPSIGFAAPCTSVAATRMDDTALARPRRAALAGHAQAARSCDPEEFLTAREGRSDAGFPRFKGRDHFPGFGFKHHGDGFRFMPGQGQRHGALCLRHRRDADPGRGQNNGPCHQRDVQRKADRWLLSLVAACELPPARISASWGRLGCGDLWLALHGADECSVRSRTTTPSMPSRRR